MKKLLILLSLLLTSNAHAATQKPLGEVIGKEIHGMATTNFTVTGVLETTGQIVETIWNYRIAVMDKHAIAVSNVVIGFFLLILAFWAAKRLSRIIGSKLSHVARIEKSVADALEKISYYVLLILFTLSILDYCNVPLTAFTFIGGALAIGVGFGSQNIIGNFISGLILIIERPIKVGDLVEVNNTLGKIVNIGARCTHLRTGNSIDILVPNSQMLESKVINWTFNDTTVRVNITLGVAYENDTKKVETLLLKAANDVKYILKTPEAQVFFTAFGEYALQFEVFFWMDMSVNVEKRKIINDLNHRISELFTENHITFASPQRDVRLSSGGAIEVKVVS